MNDGNVKIEWIQGEMIKFEGFVTEDEIQFVLTRLSSKELYMFKEMEKIARNTGKISDKLMAISEFYKLKERLW